MYFKCFNFPPFRVSLHTPKTHFSHKPTSLFSPKTSQVSFRNSNLFILCFCFWFGCVCLCSWGVVVFVVFFLSWTFYLFSSCWSYVYCVGLLWPFALVIRPIFVAFPLCLLWCCVCAHQVFDEILKWVFSSVCCFVGHQISLWDLVMIFDHVLA